MGEYQKAIEYYEKALNIMNKQYGVNSLRGLNTTNRMSCTYQKWEKL